MMALAAYLAVLLGANVYNETFDSAGKAYATSDYATAIQLYEQIIGDSVISPAVFYNLGNAYYRSGRIGPAIANYERALQIDPHFENARGNLERAVGETKRRLSRPLPPDWEQSLLFWHYGLGPRTTYLLAGLFWFVFWAALGVRQWRPVRYSRRAALVTGILAAAFGASAWAKAHPEMLAVADADRVPVHYGTNETETVHFELYAGDRVTVDKRLHGWARVSTVDGEQGWAQDKGLMFVGPPYGPPPAPETQQEAAAP